MAVAVHNGAKLGSLFGLKLGGQVHSTARYGAVAQVAQGHNGVNPLRGKIGNAASGRLDLVFKLQALHVCRGSAVAGRGGGDAEDADVTTAALQHRSGAVAACAHARQQGLGRVLAHDIGAQHRKLGRLGICAQHFLTEVELMVAQAHSVVACGVHELDGRGALGERHDRHALRRIACINQQAVGGGGVQGRHVVDANG